MEKTSLKKQGQPNRLKVQAKNDIDIPITWK